MKTVEREPPRAESPMKEKSGRSFRVHLKEFVHSGLIHVALALGFSIIASAWLSKRVLPEPVPNLYLTIPGFLALAYETLAQTATKKRIPPQLLRSLYWVTAILLSTLIIILVHWN
jgi:hypothetical protein